MPPIRGKVAGAAVGLWAAGPVGAAVGLALGHTLDRREGRPSATGSTDAAYRRDFSRALLSLLLAAARVDGAVGPREVAAIRAVFLERMRLSGEEREAVRAWLADALAGRPSEVPAVEPATEWVRERVGPEQRVRVLEALHDVVLADGPPGPEEVRLLVSSADALGPGQGTLGEAYRRLGLLPGASPGEVRRAYRRLALEHHPDRAVRRGADAERHAEGAFRGLREAYDRIVSARGGLDRGRSGA